LGGGRKGDAGLRATKLNILLKFKNPLTSVRRGWGGRSLAERAPRAIGDIGWTGDTREKQIGVENSVYLFERKVRVAALIIVEKGGGLHGLWKRRYVGKKSQQFEVKEGCLRKKNDGGGDVGGEYVGAAKTTRTRTTEWTGQKVTIREINVTVYLSQFRGVGS